MRLDLSESLVIIYCISWLNIHWIKSITHCCTSQFKEKKQEMKINTHSLSLEYWLRYMTILCTLVAWFLKSITSWMIIFEHAEWSHQLDFLAWMKLEWWHSKCFCKMFLWIYIFILSFWDSCKSLQHIRHIKDKDCKVQIESDSFKTLTQFSVSTKINVLLTIILVFLHFISRLKHRVVRSEIACRRVSRITDCDFFSELTILKSEWMRRFHSSKMYCRIFEINLWFKFISLSSLQDCRFSSMISIDLKYLICMILKSFLFLWAISDFRSALTVVSSLQSDSSCAFALTSVWRFQLRLIFKVLQCSVKDWIVKFSLTLCFFSRKSCIDARESRYRLMWSAVWRKSVLEKWSQ